jgi:uncharacterized protein
MDENPQTGPSHTPPLPASTPASTDADLPKRAAQRTSDVDVKMLELLVCPLTKGRLTLNEARTELISASASLAYPIRDGIPIMLVSEARRLEQ